MTINDVAVHLQVSRHWIVRRINDGTITIRRDTPGRRYLFPDTAASLTALQDLKAGKRRHLAIEQFATE